MSSESQENTDAYQTILATRKKMAQKIHAQKIREMREAQRHKEPELRELRGPSSVGSVDYDKYTEPEDVKIDLPKNPYDYGNDLSKVPAMTEVAVYEDLFPYRNSKNYNAMGGREFLADFTKQTRGQLIQCMSRVAQENPREFARIWIEMEKFNTPQQSAVDVNANLTTRGELYAKLNAYNSPNGVIDAEDAQVIEEDAPAMIEEPEEMYEADMTDEDIQQPNDIEYGNATTEP